MTAPPRQLQTTRLFLRAPTEADVPDIFAYASDPEVTRLMDWPRAEEPKQVGEFLQHCVRGWLDGSEYTWAITEAGAGRVIGAVALRAREHEADFGYVLNRRTWGRGLATEASSAVVEWALFVRGLPRIWATCDVENHRSARVLEKLGLTRERVLPGNVIRPNVSATPRDSYLYGLNRVPRQSDSVSS